MKRKWITGIVLVGIFIAMAGCSVFPEARVAIVCYDDTGAPAEAFAGGFVITDIPASAAEAAFSAEIARWTYGAVLGEERPWEGNLAVAGDAGSREERRFFVARYQEENGNPEDLQFEDDGMVLTDFPGASSASALALAVDYAQNTIVVAGKARVGDGHRFAVARYYWSGRLFSDFDGDGKVLTNFPEADDAVARAVASVPMDDDMRIVAGGDARFGDGRRFAIARYRSNGNLDGEFDSDGRVITDFPETSTESISDLAVTEIDGEFRTVAAGGAFSDDRYSIALARYLWDGSLDPEFGSGGRLLVDVPGSTSSYALALKIDDEERILIAGYTKDVGGDDQFMLARFTVDGSPDPDFGTAGFAVTGFIRATGAVAHGMDLDREGRILVAGQAFEGGWKFAVARFLPDGSLDPAFSVDGRVLTDLPTRNEMAQDIAFDHRPLPNRVACAVGQAGD